MREFTLNKDATPTLKTAARKKRQAWWSKSKAITFPIYVVIHKGNPLCIKERRKKHRLVSTEAFQMPSEITAYANKGWSYWCGTNEHW